MSICMYCTREANEALWRRLKYDRNRKLAIHPHTS